MDSIFIINGQTDERLDHIHTSYVLYNRHRQKLNGEPEMFEMTVIGDGRYAEYLGDDNKLIVPGEDGELLEFRIFEAGKYRQGGMLAIDVYSRATYLDLQNAKIFDPQKTDPLTTVQHVTEALDGTGWQPGNIELAGIRQLEFDNPFNSYDYLRHVAREFELELRFYVETNGQRVTGRYVDLVDRIGEWRGRTVEFGFDLQGIRRTEKTENVVTALYGYGPEREDGTRLKVFVEDEDALQRWGRGGQHIVDIYEPQTEDANMTEERLTTLTRAELDKRINAVVEYEADIVDLENVPGMANKKIRFADTIRIKDTKFNPALYVEARIHTQERDVFTKANKHVELGDFVEYTQEEVQAIWEQLREQIRKKISMNDLVEYAELKIHRDTTPPQETEHLWLDTTFTPNVLKRYDGTGWVKATPTEAAEVGAETPQGAQDKADTAEDNAKNWTDQYAVMLDRLYNGAKMSSTGGFESVRDDQLVRVRGNASVGFVIESRASTGDPWTPVFYVDNNGNGFFAGDLAGASGTFKGDIEGATIVGSKLVTLYETGDDAITIDRDSFSLQGSRTPGFGAAYRWSTELARRMSDVDFNLIWYPWVIKKERAVDGLTTDDIETEYGPGYIKSVYDFAGTPSFREDFLIDVPKLNITTTDGIEIDGMPFYESGNWTPRVDSTGTSANHTYTTQIGRYVRIGNQVTIYFNIALNVRSASATGTFLIADLPFPINQTARVAVTLARLGSVSIPSGRAFITGANTGNFLALYGIGDNNSPVSLDINTHIRSGSLIEGQATYEIG